MGDSDDSLTVLGFSDPLFFGDTHERNMQKLRAVEKDGQIPYNGRAFRGCW